MIFTTITSRKRPTPPARTPPPVVNNTALPYVTNLAIYNEAKRRNNIIKQLVKEFKYKSGDVVECKNPQDQAKWGSCTIISVLDDYQHMEKDHKWPANDNPMIVTASSNVGEIFYATTNYFQGGVDDSEQAL